MAEKTYRRYAGGQNASDPETVGVVVEDAQGTHPLHCEGTDQADLARAILADHFGRLPPPSVSEAFARDVITPRAGGQPWSITSADIGEWLAARGDAR